MYHSVMIEIFSELNEARRYSKMSDLCGNFKQLLFSLFINKREKVGKKMSLRPKNCVSLESLGRILRYSPLWYLWCPRTIFSQVSPVELEPAGTFVEHLCEKFFWKVNFFFFSVLSVPYSLTNGGIQHILQWLSIFRFSFQVTRRGW